MSTRRHVVQCTRCDRQESLTAGTAMENTKLLLTKWFLAAWLVSHSKRRIPGLELARRIGVRGKTGRNVLLSLREAMARSDAFGPPGGEAEAGDFLLGTIMGGRVGRGCEKQPLTCAVERGAPGRRGRCAIGVVADCKGGTYAEFAEARVDVLSHVVADDRNGIRGGLAGWPNLDQRKFDAVDPGSAPGRAPRHLLLQGVGARHFPRLVSRQVPGIH